MTYSYYLSIFLALVPAAASASPGHVHTPVTFWIAPPISSGGVATENLKTNVALSLGASAYARLEGVDLGVGASWVRGAMLGAQITAGLNWAGEASAGVQLSGGANVIEASLTGAQITGGFNYAGELRGAQLSLVNYAGDVRGAQVGLINIAGRVAGTQLGLVNFAEESAAPLGIVNLIRDGQHHVAVWSSETTPLNVGLKLGGRTLYTLLAAGLGSSDGTQRWLAGVGLGAHVPIAERFHLDAEILASHVNEAEAWTSDTNLLGSLRVSVGYQFFSHLSVFGGATLNVLVGEEGFGLIEGWKLSDDVTATPVSMWPGLIAGVQI